MNPILDASLFVASLSPAERHHTAAAALFNSHPGELPYFVPSLFRVEVIAALARRGESAALCTAVDAKLRGPRFVSCPVDEALIERAVEVAQNARLRAYDAVYVALALKHRAPLYTLDAEMGRRAAGAYPDLRIVGQA